MCGRVQLTHSAEDIAEFFDVDPAQLEFSAPRYNLAPGARLPVLRLADADAGADAVDRRELVALRWGLIPPWAKDPKIGYRMINARSETAAEKPSFRSAWKRRRCAVAASGYYEWWRRKPKARPERAYHFHPVDEPVFAFAGLWERWDGGEGGPLETCTILTMDASPELLAIHDRMPVMLSAETLPAWLDAGDAPALASIAPPGRTGVHVAVDEVSTVVNDARNDVPECIEPSPGRDLAERLMQQRGWSDGFEASAFGPEARWRDPASGAPGRLDPNDGALASTLVAEMDAASVDVTTIAGLPPAEVAEAWLTWRA